MNSYKFNNREHLIVRELKTNSLISFLILLAINKNINIKNDLIIIKCESFNNKCLKNCVVNHTIHINR